YITALTCDADAIDLNGHTLYVNGEAYTEGTASEGEAVEMTVSEGSGMDMPGEGPDGMGEAPDGSSDGPSGTPPELPDGAAPGEPPSGEPPAGAPGSSQN
ncbi:MAG: hypothetical protein IIY36_05495, partial [Lachnospiraceae bacterium]|nr:hypothetical protein [Lachnospiraceae bacterium]